MKLEKITTPDWIRHYNLDSIIFAEYIDKPIHDLIVVFMDHSRIRVTDDKEVNRLKSLLLPTPARKKGTKKKVPSKQSGKASSG